MDHLWREPLPGEPLEEGGVCVNCGRRATSEADEPCVPLESEGR